MTISEQQQQAQPQATASMAVHKFTTRESYEQLRNEMVGELKTKLREEENELRELQSALDRLRKAYENQVEPINSKIEKHRKSTTSLHGKLAILTNTYVIESQDKK
jgi:predicted transcriptional regulator